MSLRGDLGFCRHLRRTPVQVSSLLITGDCFVGKNKSPPRNDILRIAENLLYTDHIEYYVLMKSVYKKTHHPLFNFFYGRVLAISNALDVSAPVPLIAYTMPSLTHKSAYSGE